MTTPSVPPSPSASRLFADTSLHRRKILFASVAALLGSGSLVAPSAHASDWLWGSTGTGGDSTVNGSWIDDSLTANWFFGGAATPWVGGNTAVFGGTAGNVTVSGTINGVNGLTFNTTGYSLTGGTLTLTGPTVTVNTGVNATVGSTLAGTNGLTVAGNGTLTLTAAAVNTLTGAYTINAGSTLITVGDAFSATGNDVVVNGTLDLSTTSALASGRFINSLTGSGTITSTSSTAGSSVRVKSGDFSGSIQDGGVGKPTSVLFQATGGLLNLSGNNTYTGDTLIREGGTLRLSSANALPANSLLRFAGPSATLELANGDFTRNVGTTTATGLVSLEGGNNYFAARGADRTVNLGSTALTWGVTAGFNPGVLGFGSTTSTHTLIFTTPINFNATGRTIETVDGAAAIDGELRGVVTGGAGALTKTGTGTLLLSAATNVAGLRLKAGTTTIGTGGSFTGTAFSSVGVANGDTATLNVIGNGFISNPGQDFNVSDITNSRGTLNMQSTGTVTVGTLYVGKSGTAVGVLNQSSGTITNSGGGEWRIGGASNATTANPDVNAYGVVNISGGTFAPGVNAQIGGGGRGVVNISNSGSMTAGGWMSLARFASTSRGLLNIDGGSYTHTPTGTTTTIVGEQGAGVINVNGGTLTENSSLGLRLSNGAGSSGIVNVLAGTVTAQNIHDNGGSSFLYLNGGTIRSSVSNAGFLQGLDNAVVGPNGAVFNTNGFNITVAQPLNAPAGQGVLTIPITNGGSGYVGQPIVEITGGGGTGASAVANVIGGVVTSITITNPGINYSTTPTVALLGGGAATAATVGTVGVGANTTTGGLTKTGNGTMTLTGASSYLGATTITAGTLAANAFANGGVNSALGASSSAASNLVFNGGTLQFTGTAASTDRNFTINPGLTGTIDVSSAAGVLTLTGGSAATNGNLTKTGAGTLVLAGSNLHTGTTTAAGGVLAVSGTQVGPFAVNGGRIAPGYQTVGTVTVPSLSFGTTGGVDFEFGVGNDQVVIANAGGLALGSASLNLYQSGGTTPFTANGTYTLFDYNTSFTGNVVGAFSIANSQPGKFYGINVNSGATTIELTIGDSVSASWNVDGGGSWNTAGNWTGPVPNSAGAAVTFGPILTAPNSPASIAVGGPKTVGTIVFDNANSYQVTGGAADTITVDNGIGTAVIATTGGSHGISAPLVLVNPLNLNPAANSSLNLSGNITGGQPLSLIGTGTVTLAGSNTLGGAVTIGSGTLEVASSGALNGAASVVEKSGALLRVTGGAVTLSPAITLDIGAAAPISVDGNIPNANGNFTIEVNGGTDATLAGLVSNASGSLIKRGNGSLKLTNAGASTLANVPNLAMVIQGGSVILDGGAAATYAVNGGELAVGDETPNQVSLTLASGTLNVGTFLSVGRGNGSTSLSSSLNITGGTLNTQNLFTGFASSQAGYNAQPQVNISGNGVANASATIRLGESAGSFGTATLTGTSTLFSGGDIQVGWGGRGLLKIGAGTTASGNQFIFGGAANGSGAVWNRGTLLDRSGASTNHFALGNAVGAYGYYLNDTSTPVTLQEVGIGGAGGGSGVFEMRAGQVTAANWITLNRTNGNNATSGMLLVNGGTIVAPNTAGRIYANQVAGADLYTVIDVSGTGKIDGGANTDINLNNSANANHQTTLTVHDGGSVEVSRIFAAQAAGTAVVNLSGGTLVAEAAGNLLDTNLDAVVLHAGGGTIDTRSFNVTNANPLLAPTGNGITSIPILNGGSGYIGRPIVRITDPTGIGATAVANFDETTGALTGITITSPGTGYTAPVITLVGGGAAATAVLDVPTLGASATTGGLTKQGNGTLTLSAVNTYAGPTVIEAGTLALTGSIGGSASVSVKSGATFDVSGVAGGFSVANGQTLRGNGTVNGGVSLAAGAKLSPGDTLGTLSFNSNLDLTLAVTPVASSALVFELGPVATSDKVVLGGSATLSIGSGVLAFDDFSFTNAGGLASGTYTLFDTGSSLLGSLDAAHLTGAIGAFTGTLSVSGDGQDVLLTVVPEPSAATALLASLGSLIGLRRRRRS